MRGNSETRFSFGETTTRAQTWRVRPSYVIMRSSDEEDNSDDNSESGGSGQRVETRWGRPNGAIMVSSTTGLQNTVNNIENIFKILYIIYIILI